MMTLEEAVELKNRIEHLCRKTREVALAGRPRFYTGDDIPGDFWVVTEDGKTFSIMYFVGSYSDYHYAIIDSEADWDARNYGFRDVNHG